MKMTERLKLLRQRVRDQRAWIASHGGDHAGYVRHYGDPGIAPCDENGNAKTISCPPDLAEACGLRPVPNADGCYYQEMFGWGGTAIYDADYATLQRLEDELRDLEPRYGRYLDVEGEALESQEFDMVYWFNGSYWERDFAAFNAGDLQNSMRRIRADHGQHIPVMVLHHRPHMPLFATSYSDKGLQRLFEDQIKVFREMLKHGDT